jgi:hypothetical protein
MSRVLIQTRDRLSQQDFHSFLIPSKPPQLPSMYLLCIIWYHLTPTTQSTPRSVSTRVSCSEGPGFKSEPGDRLSWLWFFVFLLSPSRQIPDSALNYATTDSSKSLFIRHPALCSLSYSLRRKINNTHTHIYEYIYIYIYTLHLKVILYTDLQDKASLNN